MDDMEKRLLPKIRVLVVDDSAFARLAISRELRTSENIIVIDSARDGLEALEKVKEHKPDVVTLDVEMPRLDGLETLKIIMAECPTPVVMLSSQTGAGAETTVKALEMGAVDFFPKHSVGNPVGSDGDALDLKTKIMMASRVKISKSHAANSGPADAARLPEAIRPREKADTLVIIGSSTGGPRALYQVIPSIPADIPAAVLVVQHMPPGFTNSLANRLNDLSKLTVKEAAQGDVLYKGAAFIARGGYHVTVGNGGVLELNQDHAVCGVRPSIDVAMESAVKVFGRSIVGVVLTGMGCDGTHGSKLIKEAGGVVLAEDKSTCVVWGMPRSVTEAGYADRILPLPQITDGLVNALKIGFEG